MKNGLEQTLARLSPAQRRVFLRRLRQQSEQAAPRPLAGAEERIERRRAGAPPPLSFSQWRLWFLDQLEADSLAYNLAIGVELRGPLQVAALTGAAHRVACRHESLRTTFPNPADDEEPVQAIAPEPDLDLPRIDLGKLPPQRRVSEASRRELDLLRRPFDLARGPLLRLALVELGEEHRHLVVVLHHIVADGWSLGVFVEELVAFYEACREGRVPSLPALPVQYGDFALWQRRRLDGEVLERELAYWRERLAGVPELLELPADRPRPEVSSGRGGRVAWSLSPASTSSLAAFGRDSSATLFMTLLAAFQAFLHRYTGAGDLVVGTPVAGRQRIEVEGLIGHFINTLALRSDVTGDPTFRELLERVRESATGAFAHQELPFERLVEALQPERSLRHSPIFQVMLVLQNAPRGARQVSGLTVVPFPLESGASKFDLTLSLAESQGALTGLARIQSRSFRPHDGAALGRATAPPARDSIGRDSIGRDSSGRDSSGRAGRSRAAPVGAASAERGRASPAAAGME